ncbi:MAG: porin family protein [Bacteroidota bacterium]|nr:porin family protein [Bacteroidota bacterium]
MRQSRIISVTLIAALKLGGFCNAQTIQPAKAPTTYYVGVQSFRGRYEVFYPTTPSEVGVEPWQLVAGIQLAPRWVVQVGYSYSSRRSVEDPSYTGTTLIGQYISGRRGSDSHEQAVPLLLNYAVVRSPNPRLQIDVIVGLTWVQTAFRSYGTDYIDGQVAKEYYVSDHATQFYFTGGLGARYPFGRHFEGVFNWTYSRNFRSVPEVVHFSVTGNRYGLTRALSLGLRYRFAVKKKVPAAGS